VSVEKESGQLSRFRMFVSRGRLSQNIFTENANVDRSERLKSARNHQ
jgi:hypothetical protein